MIPQTLLESFNFNFQARMKTTYLNYLGKKVRVHGTFPLIEKENEEDDGWVIVEKVEIKQEKKNKE